MNTVTTADGPHDALSAYVVGALEPADHDAFERHLSVCAQCRAEAVGLEETAGRLGLLASAPPPPTALRTAVLSSLPEVTQLPAASGTAPVVDLAQHRRPERADRRTRVLTLLVAAVSVVALALGGVVHTLSGRQQAPVAGSPADTSLLAAPDARIVPATLPDGTNVSFVVSRSQNRAVFVAPDLPDPGAGKTYQLWTLRSGVAHPDGTVGGGADVSAWFHGSVARADGLAVTIEPDGGSQHPTPPVLASAQT